MILIKTGVKISWDIKFAYGNVFVFNVLDIVQMLLEIK
jgi:hypothetical protein